MTGLLANSWRIPADGHGLIRLTSRIGLRGDRGDRDPAVSSDARGRRRQHDPASPGLVGRKPHAQTRPRLAARRPEAAVLQARAGEFPQRPAQADLDRQHHDGAAMAGARSPRSLHHAGCRGFAAAGAGADAETARRGGDRARLHRGGGFHVPVPDLVPAPENVVPGPQGRIQAERRRSAYQGAHPASCGNSAPASA